MTNVVRQPEGRVLIHSAQLVDDGQVTENGWILIQRGFVDARGAGDTWQQLAHVDEVIDASESFGAGAIMSPGFVDAHGHGGAGVAYDDGVDAIRTARALHREHGTTSAVISLVTAPLEDLEASVAAIAELTKTDPDVLGSHLEGPFLDPGHQGAHEPTLLRTPTPESIARLLEAGNGTVRQITIAPELPGGLAAIEQIVAAGAVAAVGHTDATEAQAREAFDAGATLLTHAFNAMRPIHHRAPGPVLAAAADERVVLEGIADGVHLHADVIRLLFQVAPGRVALVTDAMAAAGSADGHYDLGAVKVTVKDGIARTDDTGSIAGSTLTQDAALRKTVDAGVPVADALQALTATPARAMGRTDVGTLAIGSRADVVLLGADLQVGRVYTAY